MLRPILFASAARPSALLLTATLTATLAATVSSAQSAVTWFLDESITRGQTSLSWTSPTAIGLGFDSYVYDYEITKLEAVASLFTPITVDVTDMVGESIDLIGSGEAPALPAVVFDQELNDPDIGTKADIFIEVDTNGFGQARFTNVELGQVTTPLGTLDIDEIRIEATIFLLGVAGPEPGDYTGDGAVDQLDYQRWVQEFGNSGPTVTADGNDDQSVDAADYTIWRDRFDSPLDATATPEPTAAVLLLSATAGAAIGRRR